MRPEFSVPEQINPPTGLDSEELRALLEPVKPDFEVFDRRIAECMECDSPLVTSIAQHLLQSKGKRIRPALLFLLSRATGQFTENTIDASVAIELIHAATLLHDDVVDKSELRRNQETVNARWTNLISVLMGDYLFAKAFKLLSSIGSPELMQAVSLATERVSVGELRQIEETRNYDMSEKEYLRIISDKTASLFDIAAQVGPILVGAKQEDRQRLSRFGEAIGVSFQIADDLLDFVGESSETGKTPGNDALTGKVTLPLIYSLQTNINDETTKVREMLVAGVQERDFPRVLNLVRSSGGIDYAYNRAQEICEAGFSEISHLGDSVYFDSLSGIARFATRRRN